MYFPKVILIMGKYFSADKAQHVRKCPHNSIALLMVVAWMKLDSVNTILSQPLNY